MTFTHGENENIEYDNDGFSKIVESKIELIKKNGYHEPPFNHSQYMDIETGLQTYDKSFLGTNECFGLVLDKLAETLPKKEDISHLHGHPKWGSATAFNKSIVDIIYQDVIKNESDQDMAFRINNDPYPLDLDNYKGYILSGDFGTGKTTKLLTHYAGDKVRSFVCGYQVIYLDYLDLTDPEFWKSNNVNYLVNGKKSVYINDFGNSDIISGFEGKNIRRCISELIFRCYSHNVNLNISTNIPADSIKEFVSSNFGASKDDRLPKTIIKFEGKSFRDRRV